jgi:hypothetical protein
MSDAEAAHLSLRRLGVIRMLSRGRIVGGIACALALTAVVGCWPRDELQFSPTTLPDAQVGSAYAVTITISGAETPVGHASVEDGSLPAGLNLEVIYYQPYNTIKISGTPTAPGTFSFTIHVMCEGTSVAGQEATQGYTLVVR